MRFFSLLALVILPSTWLAGASPAGAQDSRGARRAPARPIPGPPPQPELRHRPVTRDVAWEDQLVSPVPRNTRPDDLEFFHELGRLDAEGFATLTLSVAGRYAGSRPSSSPRLEVVLLPDVPFVVEAWRKDGVLLLAERVSIALSKYDKGLFDGRADPVQLRFPAYRAFLRHEEPPSLRVRVQARLGE